MATRRSARRDKQNKRTPNIEGEGSYEAATRYDESVDEFLESADVDALAREAKRAIESDEGESLREAEREGRKPARH